jgi:hypothetical protein
LQNIITRGTDDIKKKKKKVWGRKNDKLCRL